MKEHAHRESMESIKVQMANLVGPGDGFFGIKQVTFDPEIGAEMVIFLQDDSPNIEELLRMEPFGLGVNHGIWQNMFGPIGWILTSVYQHDPDNPICSIVRCFNPHSEQELAPWRRLAKRADWHLFVIAGRRMCRYIDFDNSSDKFNLVKGLNMIVEEGSSTPMVDRIKAEKLFRSQRSAADLLNMPKGRTTLHVHPSASN
jgi:hypothetical protein